jgi:hypothetical protein
VERRGEERRGTSINTEIEVIGLLSLKVNKERFDVQ